MANAIESLLGLFIFAARRISNILINRRPIIYKDGIIFMILDESLFLVILIEHIE